MKGENYLLSIAIDNYADVQYPTLNNARLDAERFNRIMQEMYSFTLIQEPIYNEKANRRCIVEALHSLGNFLNKDDSIIIYFAGHGTIDHKTKRGFWIPSDAGNTVADYVSNSVITDALEGIEAKHVLIISDSCFSGALLNLTRDASTNHYRKIGELKSRWVLCSGRQEPVSDGQPGIGSPFALALSSFLENNKEEYFSVLELINSVSKATGTNTKQQPVFGHIMNSGHSGGQMIFRLNNYEAPAELDVDDELKAMVVSYDISQQLHHIGYKEKSLFGYYQDNRKHIIVKRVDGQLGFLCNAYLFEEISKGIPEHIDVDENTYLAYPTEWKRLTTEEIEEEYLDATVVYQRTDMISTPNFAICRCKNQGVAFSFTKDGTAKNLICWGANQADSAGQMLIRLVEEGKIQIA